MLSCLRYRAAQTLLKRVTQHEARVALCTTTSPTFGTCPRQGKPPAPDPKDTSGPTSKPQGDSLGGSPLPPSSGDSSMRDLVNFPRRVRRVRTPATVLGFIPKSMFDFFYSKTGVTGGYMFLFGITTYMLSKEIYVLDVEFVEVMNYALYGVVLGRYVPEIRDWLSNQQNAMVEDLDSLQENEKKGIRDTLKQIETRNWQIEGVVSMLSEARRECVYLQMEAAYRDYLQQVYTAVKTSLDYNVQISNVKQKYAASNLTHWVLNEVSKSITPELKKNSLSKAIMDLKSLAAR